MTWLASKMLRPTIINPNRWHREPRKRAVPDRIRKQVLARDNNTCVSCAHRARLWMHIHHVTDEDDDSLPNLATVCPACHAIMHFGRSMAYETIEIWKTAVTQLEIVQRTREGIRQGKTLAEINGTFGLKKGRFKPNSLRWAAALSLTMEDEPEASLPEPLCAVFMKFNQWQIEG